MFKSFFENAPKIIAEAASSPLGIVALVLFVLSVLAVILFRRARVENKAVTFIALVFAFGTFVFAVFRIEWSIPPENDRKIPANEVGQSPLHEKARETLDQGRKAHFAGRQDEAVSAYEQASRSSFSERTQLNIG